jgi:hypothetical protein
LKEPVLRILLTTGSFIDLAELNGTRGQERCPVKVSVEGAPADYF